VWAEQAARPGPGRPRTSWLTRRTGGAQVPPDLESQAPGPTTVELLEPRRDGVDTVMFLRLS